MATQRKARSESSASYPRDDDIALYEIAALLGCRVVAEVAYALAHVIAGTLPETDAAFFDLSGYVRQSTEKRVDYPGNDWECDRAYRKRRDSCELVNAPKAY
jgi:hypothetical protein